jgi:putative nucleotidyltransferase with HDIG domain
MPAHVRYVLRTLRTHGFEAYAVGGAVRDILLGRRPEDWDVATSAEPRYVLSVFPQAIPTGVRHGTVTVLCPPEGSRLDGETTVDVTTYRVEGAYSDLRHPDSVRFTTSLREDLSRRDFTINALALGLNGAITDPFGGLRDITRRLLRCVGKPEERFAEDALRMVRAVRLVAELGLTFDLDTAVAVERHSGLLARIAVERVREEFDRCLLGPAPWRALELLRTLDLLDHILPELLEGVGFEQNEYHAYSVWDHTLITLGSVPPVLELRLAALLHDVGKPRTLSVEDGRRHFYNHEKVGADMVEEILARLRYGRTTIARVAHLVRNHMALHWQPDMKDVAVRRLINRVGPESISDLLYLRRADRMASGAKEGPIGLGTAALLVRIERLMKDEQAFTVADLAIDGDEVMRVGKVPAGPQVGIILRRLLEEVLEDPDLNETGRLEARVREIVRPGLPPKGGR